MKKWIPFVLLFLFSGCGVEKSPVHMEGAGKRAVENIQVENYYETGKNLEYFREVPSRVVVIGANETETLLDLGVAGSILCADDGQNNARYNFKEENRKIFETLPKIDRKTITAEHLLALSPDLIIAEQQFFSKNRLGSTAYWNEKGVYTMVPLNTTSPGKMNQAETIEKEMKYIEDLGVIFHKEEKAKEIVDATYRRIAEINEMGKHKPKPKVMILDRMSILASYGKQKIAGAMASAIGGDVPDTPAAVSDEMLIKINPDVVFFVFYRDEEAELAFLKEKKAFQHLHFIQNERLYGIPLKYVYGPQSRTIDAINYMAERMYGLE